MKVPNIITMAMLIGGLIVLTSGKQKVESYISFSKEIKTETILEEELNKEIDELVKKELEPVMSFEDVFETTKEKLIEPIDIHDVKEEEVIVYDVSEGIYTSGS
ncbi:hypothetical protein IWQ47_004703 [Aquimarina sp. EL_43]|uniref:hypothetical protein n=1 Tax=unclassified Aquimarina TaxID=2627091 RepID=UPI0018C92044|nr:MULTISPECIES: hypothetical protein [unclassified Aquimarina]MBG6133370.1 hypothetical protein [Aquimarina sp. EL_35]MBG6153451.1 hypothetical protein [Aquimarina sp. EL_32]MBG6171607.1 hypothetical protein [Aquimarina sp. EL_43]